MKYRNRLVTAQPRLLLVTLLKVPVTCFSTAGIGPSAHSLSPITPLKNFIKNIYN